MSGHTPGPWVAFFNVHGDPSVVIDERRPDFTRVCAVDTSPEDYGRSNARLIAAAPEMLASLRECLRVVALYAEWPSGRAFGEGERARKLIASIDGEATP